MFRMALWTIVCSKHCISLHVDKFVSIIDAVQVLKNTSDVVIRLNIIAVPVSRKKAEVADLLKESFREKKSRIWLLEKTSYFK